jgi:hypothetical protein
MAPASALVTGMTLMCDQSPKLWSRHHLQGLAPAPAASENLTSSMLAGPSYSMRHPRGYKALRCFPKPVSSR